MTEIALKILMTSPLAGGIWGIYHVWRRGKFNFDYLWMLASIVFAIILLWASGLAIWLALLSTLICIVVLVARVFRVVRGERR